MNKIKELKEIKERALADLKPLKEDNFHKKQTRIVLRNCGLISPDEIKDYIAFDGYEALGKILTEMNQDEVIQTVKDSGLRGRGGAGFPTGKKWEIAYKYNSDKKYVVCNAYEGDPGVNIDKTILEGDPHSILEAMTIAGYAIGSDQGYIYINSKYTRAINRLKIAINEAKEYNLLGEDILGRGFNFDIELKFGRGSFMCGERTALMESIEGKRAMPRAEANITAENGLWGKPTIINNVETLANIPIIFQKGVDWFKSIGTDKSPGTKVFALGGKIEKDGLIEVPMGITLREIIYDIGGGIPDKKEFKAIQIGGPTGGCIPEIYLDIPIDFESLEKMGTIMGSGGMVVMDETDSMVDIARFSLAFAVDESCGKCIPCREGTKRMLETVDKIIEGKGEYRDISKILSLSETISSASLCGLGKTAPNPFTTTVKHFREEYDAYIDDSISESSYDTQLEYFITDKCIGCTKCARNCPVSCIDGKVKERHVIRTNECIKCGTCREVCPVSAVITHRE